jgi:glycosyltransferase involved in cell wall biosynthesis
MLMLPKVSIVIPTYNRPEMICTAVNSSLIQGEILGEVIVVDDNDNNEIYQATKDAVVQIGDTRLRYIKNNRKKGGCGARNTGLLESIYEYIVFLDDDDELLPEALVNHYKQFDTSSVAMVYGGVISVDKIFNLSVRYELFDRIISPRSNLEINCPSTLSSSMFKKEIFEQVGLFDEDLVSFQDYDMWIKINQFFTIKSHKALVAKFYQHSEDRTSINLSRRFEGLNRVCDRWKHLIEKKIKIKDFKNRYTSAAYFSNGQIMLASGIANRPKAIYFMLLAVVLSPDKKLPFLFYLFLGFLGFNVTKFMKIILYRNILIR